MYRSRPAQRIEMPASLRHCVSDLMNIQLRRLGRKCYDRSGRRAEYIQFRNGIRNGVGNRTRTRNDFTTGFEVAAKNGIENFDAHKENKETYSDPIYCIVAQVPAINAPGLYVVRCKNYGTNEGHTGNLTNRGWHRRHLQIT